MTLHKDLALLQRHPPHNWEFADSTARLAASVTADDVFKTALQLDNNTTWLLTDDSPLTWVQLTGSGSGGTLTTEQVQDIVGAMGVNGTGLTFVYDDGAGTITFNLDVTNAALLEAIRDAIGAALVEGSGIDVTVNDGADTITIAVTAAAPSDHNHTSGVGDGGVLTNDLHDGYSEYDEIATPSNPAANKLRIYPKDVGGVTKLHTLDSAGTETELGSGSGLTQEQVEDFVGALLIDTTSIDVIYTDGSGTLELAIKDEYLMDWLGALIADSTNIDVTYNDGADTFVLDLTAAAKTVTLNFVIDGGGSVITTGIKGDIVVDFAHTITGVTALADQSGSIVVDIWNDTYANFPPTDADSITASAPVTISTATKSQDTTLTGWDTSGAAGSVYRFNVDSVTSITRCTIALKVVRA